MLAADDQLRVNYISSLTALVGLYQVLFGVLQLHWLRNFSDKNYKKID